MQDVTTHLARKLRDLRTNAGWTLDALADRTGISRAALSRLENADVSPTADQLNRLSAAHGLALSRLLAMVEDNVAAHIPVSAQDVRHDPAQGIRRRVLSPPGSGAVSEVIEVNLSPGTRVSYDRPRKPGQEHHLLMRAGGLVVTVDDAHHTLHPGDTLRYHLTGASDFQADATAGARYILVIL